MKYSGDGTIGLTVCNSREAATLVLGAVETEKALPLASLPGSVMTIDGIEIAYENVSRATAEGFYGTGVLVIGDDTFVPIINGSDMYVTTAIDDDEEVKEALQDIADTDEAEQPDAIATMVSFLSDEGKDALKAIAEDESEDLQATAKLVMDTIEPPDEAEATEEQPAAAEEEKPAE